jgi:hypothetical protein
VVGLPGTIATTTSSMFHSLSAYVRLRFPPFYIDLRLQCLAVSPQDLQKNVPREKLSRGTLRTVSHLSSHRALRFSRRE